MGNHKIESFLTVSQAQKNAPKTFYRPDLHNELKRIALLKSDKFKTPTMRLGAKVARVVGQTKIATTRLLTILKDIKLGLVTLEDGEQLAADLIIGADGERVSPCYILKPLESTNSFTVASQRTI